LGDGGVGGCATFSAFPPNILKRKKKATTTTATGSRDMTIVKIEENCRRSGSFKPCEYHRHALTTRLSIWA
jgi:hypothetical protein